MSNDTLRVSDDTLRKLIDEGNRCYEEEDALLDLRDAREKIKSLKAEIVEVLEVLKNVRHCLSCPEENKYGDKYVFTEELKECLGKYEKEQQ